MPRLLRAGSSFGFDGVWSGKGLTVRRCPGLRDFLGYKVLPLVGGKTGQVPGKLGCVGHPSPSTGSIKNIRA